MTTIEVPHIEVLELPPELDVESEPPLARERHIAHLELIRDGQSAETVVDRALLVGQAAMYVLGDRASSAYEIPPRVIDAYQQPIVHDPSRPAFVELYKFRGHELPMLSLITGRRHKGLFVGPETVIILPREERAIRELGTRTLFATDEGYDKRQFAGDTAATGKKSYADFVAYAAGVMAEVLAQPE